MLSECDACLGQRRTARRAGKQLHAEFVLKLGQSATDDRLRETKPTGRW
jgi:hypothetical protein